MSQGGHIVKPTGKRKTWAIIYRDPTGIQQWEGKFKKRTEAQARLNEVLGAIDKGPSRDPLPSLLNSSPRIGWPGDARSAAAPNRDTLRSSTSNSFRGSERLPYRLYGSIILTRP
jgi:hypothetical protein